MSLREEMARYEHLTGKSAEPITINRLCAYLDGVDRGIAELEKIKHEIGNEFVDLQDGSEEWRSYVNETVLSCYEIVEKHIEELKGENNAEKSEM